MAEFQDGSRDTGTAKPIGNVQLSSIDVADRGRKKDQQKNDDNRTNDTKKPGGDTPQIHRPQIGPEHLKDVIRDRTPKPNDNRPNPNDFRPKVAPQVNPQDFRPQVNPQDFRPKVDPQEYRPKVTPQVGPQDFRPKVNPQDYRPKPDNQPQTDNKVRPGVVGPENLKNIFAPQQHRPDNRPQPQDNSPPDLRLRDIGTKIRPGNIGPDNLKDLITPQPQAVIQQNLVRPQPQFVPEQTVRPQQFVPQQIVRPQQNNNIGKMILGSLLRDVVGLPPQPYPGGYPPGCDPNYPGYDPRYPQNDPRYPQYDPRYPQYDPRSPQYDPRTQYDPRFVPGQYQPGCQPNNPLDMFVQQGPVRDLIRQRLGQVMQNNPQAVQEIVNTIGGMSPDTKFNIDAETKTLNLAMDFTKAYDKMRQNNPGPENPEVRRLLGGLDSVSLNPDVMAFNWKNEQVINLSDTGPMKGFKLSLGGGTNQTSFNLNTTETRLNVSGIRGVEAIDPNGRRIRVHEIDMDASNPAAPKGTLLVDNPFERPKNMPANVEWPATVTLPIVLDPVQHKQIIEALPSTIRNVDTMRNAAKNGDLSQLSNINLQEMMKLFTPPAPGPGPGPTDISPRPQVDRVVPPPPQPDRVEYVPPPPPKPGILPDSVPKVDNNAYKDLPLVVPIKRTPKVEPQPEVKTEETKKPETSATNPGIKIIKKPSSGSLTSTIMDVYNPDSKSVARVEEPKTPVKKNELPLTVPAKTEQPLTVPTKVPPKTEGTAPKQDAPQLKTSNKLGEGLGAVDLLKRDGIEVKADKIGLEKLVDIFLGDADPNGPLRKEIASRMSSDAFRQNVRDVGNTLNKFDVDKTNKTITVGLDFSKGYDAFTADLPANKKAPEVKTFLAGLDSVTIGANSVKINTRGEQVLPMIDNNGSKKADLLFGGTTGGTTTIDLQTTETSLALKNIKGIQAEVKLLNARVNVHEVNIDVSNPNKPTGSVLVDNPLPKPDSVPAEYWTITLPLDLDPGDAIKRAEQAERLPQTIKSLHNMMQGAQSGKVAERMGSLTKEDIKKMLQIGG